MSKIFGSRRPAALKLAISMVAALAMGWLLARWGHSSTNRLFGASNPSTWVSVNATTNPANLNEGFSSVVEPLQVPAYQSPFLDPSLSSWKKVGDLRINIVPPEYHAACVEVTVTLAEYPETKTAQATTEPTLNASATKGLQVETLTSDVAHNLRPNTRGVVVIAVDPDSPSADAGLQRGDVIQEVSHKEVNNLDQFQAAIREAGNKSLLLLVNRGGNTQYVVLSSK